MSIAKDLGLFAPAFNCVEEGPWQSIRLICRSLTVAQPALIEVLCQRLSGDHPDWYIARFVLLRLHNEGLLALRRRGSQGSGQPFATDSYWTRSVGLQEPSWDLAQIVAE